MEGIRRRRGERGVQHRDFRIVFSAWRSRRFEDLIGFNLSSANVSSISSSSSRRKWAARSGGGIATSSARTTMTDERKQRLGFANDASKLGSSNEGLHVRNTSGTVRRVDRTTCRGRPRRPVTPVPAGTGRRIPALATDPVDSYTSYPHERRTNERTNAERDITNKIIHICEGKVLTTFELRTLRQ